MVWTSRKKVRWPLVLLVAFSAAFLLTASPASAADTGTIAVCLTDSSGNPLTPAGDQVWYQVNSGSTNYVGPVGTSGCREQTGLTAGASVAVWVEYNGTLSQHQIGTVPDGSTQRFDFYTTKVTLQYAHSIALGGPNGDSGWFKQSPATASLELLSDGVTPVHFRLDGTGGASGRTTLLWPIATGAGATFDRTLFVARLLDHSGSPLAGGTVDYYLGGWNANVGQTDANGNYVLALPNDSSDLSVAMRYGGTRNQQSRSQANASIFTFQTVLANVELQAHDNSVLDIPDNGSASYYADGWHSITSENTNNHDMVQAELLPGTYSFAATYNGTRDQKQQTLTSTPSVQSIYFHAALVSVQLLDHKGISDSPLDLGSGSYYAGGWHSMTARDVTGNEVQAEMLPGTYSFAAVYNGTSEQTTYTVIEPNPNNNANALQTVVFQTTLAVVQVQAHDGPYLDILANGSASYYANGWHSIKYPDPNNGKLVQAEMLPGTYSFALVYHGTRDQKSQAINGSVKSVYFHTGQVISDSGNATGYYAAGWQPFTSGDELLPGTYTFRFTDQANTAETVIASSTPNHIH